MNKVLKIINSGQTGVERGALDESIKHDILIGGWYTSNISDNDYYVGSKYKGLSESITKEPNQHLDLNVIDSDAILIITNKTTESNRVNEIKSFAFRYKKPIFMIKEPKDIANCAKWLDSLDDHLIINVTGPTEKEFYNGYKLAREVLNYIFLFFKYD